LFTNTFYHTVDMDTIINCCLVEVARSQVVLMAGAIALQAAKYDHIDFVPPKAVQEAARRGLELRRKQPKSKRGGLDVRQASEEGIGSGVQRAANLSSGKAVSPETVRRMLAYFTRHQKDKDAPGWGDTSNPSKGYQAWLLWGGDPGWTWSKKVVEQMNRADEDVA
jgi:hypothetical protein